MDKKEKNLTFSKFVWIFVIGSIAGYVFETSFYYIKHGVFMNKQGLLYGPIKPIYGFGCAILTYILNFVKDKSKLYIFIFGSIVGGIFEYACSLILEYFYGTRMWTYANMGLDIHGRVYLPYLPVWGLIALLWLKVVYPKFNNLYNKIPKKPLLIATILMSIFLIYDSGISTLATRRMTERAHNIPAGNKFEKYLDKHYPDEYILKKVPYLKIVD